ncbi:FG-GAP-like repeat-containing protein [Tunicatimonas pelagia]|uniref:FG-GAP-like repeat-containing protein n=1 Tax=Tunicatimonas pelagia TaxID=931531 RepID=UPI0026664954|nr:FG-GAP-like repeat-containing protein [Tunicatimonas pelagia]WKN41712.1 FG-GAP-like repeat-containing protein [Tunicatimonas pelagia]
MIHNFTCSLFCFLLFLFTLPAVAQFGGRQVVSSQQEVQAPVLVADFNQDGVSDVIVVEDESTSGSTLLRYLIRSNDGSGNFNTGQLIKEEKKEPWLDLRAQDIDGDGRIDLTLRQEEANKLGWLRNQGASFKWEANILNNFDSYGVVDYTLSRVDNDQYADLLILTETGVLWGKNNFGDPFSSPTALLNPEDENLTSIFTYDFDQDGDEDIFLLGNFVSVYRRETDGTYTFQKLEAEYFDEIREPQFADMDGDGTEDLVLTDSWGCASSNLWFYKNTGNQFSPSPNYITGFNEGTFLDVDYIDEYYPEDIDGDGDLDLYISSEYGACADLGGNETLLWIENINNWAETAARRLIEHHTVRFAHFNSDNKVDFFIAPWWFGGSSSSLEENNFDSDFIWIEAGVLNNKETLVHNYQSIDQDIKLPISDLLIDDLDGNGISIVSTSGAKVMNHAKSEGTYAATTVKYYEYDYEGSSRLNSADADGDGTRDLFVTHEQLSYVYFSWYNQTSNYYQENNTLAYLGEPLPLDLLLTDFDSDNDIDVILSDSRYNQWYTNDGNGSYTREGEIPVFNAIINYDNDGIDDFISSNATYRSLGDGTVEQVLSIGGNQVLDLNGDGRDDILSVTSGTSYWYQNLGEGTFGEQQALDLSPQNAYHFTDIDNDGDADFVYNNVGNLVWKENTDGQGTFSADQLIEAISTTVIRSADMDDDGDRDLVVGGDGFIYEYENQFTDTAPTELSLALEGKEGLQQDTIAIPLKVESGFAELASLSFSLAWDSEIATYADIESNENFTLELNSTENGKIGITWNNPGGASKADGSTLLSLQLVLVGNEESGTDVSFTSDPVGQASANAEGQTIPLTTKNTQITINPSQAPSDISLTENIVDENQAVGTEVGKFNTDDDDISDSFVYALVDGEGDNDNSSFSIDGNSLITQATFDYETDSVYSIRVQTTDTRGKTFAKIFTIKIGNVDDTNNSPTDITLSATSVDENSGSSVVIGEFTITDADPEDNHTLSFVGGEGSDDNDAFAIGSSQELIAREAFDYEAQSEYEIRIQADDSNGGRLSKAFTITVNDLDESTNSTPTAIELNETEIEENQPANTVVGTFTTTDTDAEDEHTYMLVEGEGDTGNGLFQIKDDQLQTVKSLDYEEQQEYSIRVKTDDGKGGEFVSVFAIEVINQADNPNQPPTDIILNANTIDENRPAGTLVGTLLTEDPDNAIFTYQLVDGSGSTDNSSFFIQGNELRSAISFDYETLSQRSIRIRSDDGRGGTFSKEFTVVINNLEDQPNRVPTNIVISNASIEEGQPSGTPVGVLSTTDPDTDNEHQYQVLNRNGQVPFSIDGDTLVSTASLDVAAQNSYLVEVQSDDGQGGVYVRTLAISVAPAGSIDVLGVINPVNDQQAAINEAFTLEIPNDVFRGDDLQITVTQADGTALPEWLTFNTETNTLSGTPPNDESLTLSITATNTAGESVSDEFVLSVEGVTALGDDISRQWNIYPIPARRTLFIQGKVDMMQLQSYRLINVQGKVVATQQLRPGVSNDVRIDVSALTGGMYLLELQTNRKLHQTRILIE